MLDTTKILIKSVVETFKINENVHVDMFLEDNLKCVRPEHHEEYFKSLFGEGSGYITALDRVSDVTKAYRKKHEDILMSKAKELSSKIKELGTALYVTKNELLKDLPMSERLKRVDLSKQFNDEEMSIIKISGIGYFLRDDRMIIDTYLLLDCYKHLFFGDRLTLKIGL